MSSETSLPATLTLRAERVETKSFPVLGSTSVRSAATANITGTGSLTKQGTDTVSLAGTNSYGATTVSGGILQVGVGSTSGTLGSAGNVVNNGVVKGDWALNAKQHISAMFFIAKEDEIFNSSSFQLAPQWESLVPANTKVYTGNWTFTPNSNWVNEARGGYAYIFNQTLNADNNILPSDAYPAGYSFPTGVTNRLYGGLPQIALSDFTGNLGGGQRTSVRGSWLVGLLRNSSAR